MSRHKVKNSTVLVIVLAVLTVVFLILSFVSAAYNVNATIKSIDAIGTVEYTEESKELIDDANGRYEGLDTNLNLQSYVTNADVLEEAKIRYVELVIIDLYLLTQDNDADESDIVAAIEAAREAYDGYFDEEESDLIGNYSDLTDAESAYGAGTSSTTSGGSSTDDDEEEIELC